MGVLNNDYSQGHIGPQARWISLERSITENVEWLTHPTTNYHSEF